ncbi:uncharacterized protein LOC144166881 [Haemaphysalis longicornis]
MPTTPTVEHGPYRGRSNGRLNRDMEVDEVRTALSYLNTRSAPGPDHITKKILRNLDDKSIENLTKGITYVEHTLLKNSAIEYCAVELITGKKKKESTFVVNTYSNPKHFQQRFRTLIHKTSQLAHANTALLCGDFNASHTNWGYPKTSAKGRSLLEDATDADYHLLNDPTAHTCLGTELDNIPTQVDDIEKWTQALNGAAQAATTDIEYDDSISQIDSRLAHLLEAKKSLQNRWRGQRHNRKLRKRIAILNREIEKHCAVLCRQQWHAVCQEADGQMHKSRTWKLLRHLLDENKTKGSQRHGLARTLHRAKQELGESELCRRLNDKYLLVTPNEPLPDYTGGSNALLDRDIEEWEVRAVIQTINCRSAAGPDKTTNNALRNMNDAAITALTRYYECWRSGRLPKHWKEAETILIPKPGKPPHIDNLRPISLTSCIGKVLEHILLNRWQAYLEDGNLYPNSILGFRSKLETQDAMLLLKHEVVDEPARSLDNRAVLGLDLKSAFDKIRHSAILKQISRLNMGQRTFAYVKDFLSNRTTTIHAGDIQLPKKQLGSVGTPQGSVISSMLFNLVMIDVANHLVDTSDYKMVPGTRGPIELTRRAQQPQRGGGPDCKRAYQPRSVRESEPPTRVAGA